MEARELHSAKNLQQMLEALQIVTALLHKEREAICTAAQGIEEIDNKSSICTSIALII